MTKGRECVLCVLLSYPVCIVSTNSLENKDKLKKGKSKAFFLFHFFLLSIRIRCRMKRPVQTFSTCLFHSLIPDMADMNIDVATPILTACGTILLEQFGLVFHKQE